MSDHVSDVEKIPWHFAWDRVYDYRWLGKCSCGYRSKYHMSPGYAESAVREHVKAMEQKALR